MSNKLTIKLNQQTNLLESPDAPVLPQGGYREFPLIEVDEPQLYRGLYDFDEVPKIIFDNVQVPVDFPKDIYLTDTTFRDGQQSMEPFTVEQIVDLFKLMGKLGGPNGFIRQSEFFPYTDKDKLAIEKCRALDLKFPEITTWIRASEKDFELIKSMGIAETGILVSCSDYHIFNKLNLTRRGALDKYLGIVKTCLEYGIRPRCHLEDITRADFFGFVIPFVQELTKLSKESGIPIKVRACDTMGYALSIQGVGIPRSVPKLIYGLKNYGGMPSGMLEWHGHNDFYRVVSNATAAWLSGCSSINCSLLGIGERTGNCPTEAMCIEYAQLRGENNGINMPVITEIAEYFEKKINYKIPPRTPFAGSAFNTTRAGIHADGLLKDQEIYSIFCTETILGRKPNVCINDTSGSAGVAFWINAYYGIDGVEKTDPIVGSVYDTVMAQYASGRNTSLSDEELDKMVKKVDKARHKNWKKSKK